MSKLAVRAILNALAIFSDPGGRRELCLAPLHNLLLNLRICKNSKTSKCRWTLLNSVESVFGLVLMIVLVLQSFLAVNPICKTHVY